MAAVLANPIARRLLRIPPSYFVFLVLLATLWIARPNMLNLNIMGIFVRQIVPLGILVLGQLVVMRVKSIDLSGGGIILLINYFISSGTFPGASMPFFVVLALATGLAIGLFNGFMIGSRRVSAVIVTLAVSIILVGLVQFLSSGNPPGDVPKLFNDFYNTKFLSVPTPVLFWVLLTALVWLLLSRTVFGRYVASVGENAEAAHFSGVPVQRTVILAHTLAGLIAAIAALVQTGSIAVG
ncbi:ABC transporter permease, partial [Mesorhizobium sp. M7A.F.Ca.CA.001.15.1.1]